MNKEKMNQAIGMLDDDVIADALEGKKTAGGVTRRKLAVALIAATLAVALIAGGIVAAFSRTGGKGPIALLPPEDATVIRNVTTTLQVTPGTIYGSGNYPRLKHSSAERQITNTQLSTSSSLTASFMTVWSQAMIPTASGR